MDFNEYQQKARSTETYRQRYPALWYPVLGLCGEAGEVAEKVKKVMRDSDGVVSEERRAEIINEMGDVLWYLANLACDLKINFEQIAIKNINKLASRRQRGCIGGDGDQR